MVLRESFGGGLGGFGGVYDEPPPCVFFFGLEVNFGGGESFLMMNYEIDSRFENH